MTSTGRLAWFNCFSGIAGDMALGALFDAGADVAVVEAGLRALPVTGWTLDVQPVLRHGLAGTRALVTLTEADQPHRHWSDIRTMLEDADLPERARQRALDAFAALARVEGRLHGVDPEHVHFHEVGAVDSIVDTVGVCLALEDLDIDEVAASAVAQGTGTIRAAHGILPNPPPAVVALLAEGGLPAYGLDEPMELTTPTGAALLVALGRRFGPLPAMSAVRATGFGAGGRDLPHRANLVQVVIGEAAAARPGAVPSASEQLVVLETTVDDVSGETLGWVVARLLESGARDAWISPVTMKKGRPGHVVTVLADPASVEPLRTLLVAETATLGVRSWPVDRWASDRHIDHVHVDGRSVRVKVGEGGRAKVEHDDAAAAARALGLPLREVVARAEAAWRKGAGH